MTAGVYRPYAGRARRPAHPRRRFALIWGTCLLASAALVARLVGLQVSPSTRLISEGEKQRLKTIPLPASRGSIVDRNGAELAISVPQTTIAADTRSVVDPARDAARLAPVLGRDVAEIQMLLSSGKSFVYLARQIDDATAKAVADLKLPYVWSYSEPKRFLPSGDGLGLSVVGRTDIDTYGVSGIEKQFDDKLRGSPGKLILEQGKGGRTIPGGQEELNPAESGQTVVLALDRGLQFEAERLLQRAIDATRAKGGTVLISKVATGEVLVDANVERDDSAPAHTVGNNRAVTWTYEPGSINKAITMAGVLEEGLATPDTSRPVSASLEVIGHRWTQETRSSDAELTLTDILKNSDNIGTMTWAQVLGPDKLNAYLRAFGLGQPTGLAFPDESNGKVADLSKWTASSLPTIAIGQGIAVTPMQMLTVYNTIASGGLHVVPKLVLGTETAAGDFTPDPSPEPTRVISPQTAAALTQMLTSVVNEGTAKKAQVSGFTVAGKTGTAWKPFEGGGYTDADGHHKLVTSFIGFLPAADPQISILVVLDEPADPYSTGGTVAAPVFRDLASYAVSHLRIPPDVAAATPGPKDRVRATPQTPPTTTTTTTVPPTTTMPVRKVSLTTTVPQRTR